jgi:hypothetical protein
MELEKYGLFHNNLGLGVDTISNFYFVILSYGDDETKKTFSIFTSNGQIYLSRNKVLQYSNKRKYNYMIQIKNKFTLQIEVISLTIHILESLQPLQIKFMEQRISFAENLALNTETFANSNNQAIIFYACGGAQCGNKTLNLKTISNSNNEVLLNEYKDAFIIVQKGQRTFQIKANRTFNFESVNAFKLLITASDEFASCNFQAKNSTSKLNILSRKQKFMITSKEITISIENRNDAPRFLYHSLNCTVPRYSSYKTPICTIIAIDEDSIDSKTSTWSRHYRYERGNS